MRIPSTLLICLVMAGLAGAQGTLAGQQREGSPRNASYEIDVRLDPGDRTLAGRQVLTWRNIQQSATQELRFHLYWNAWRNDQSTWMREDRYRRRSDLENEIQEGDWGWIQVDRIELQDGTGTGAVDLGPTLRFVAPDDGNAHDRTVMVVDLPRPVAPGEEIQVELEWRAKIPRTFERTGFRGEFFFLAHWFPKLGVFEAEGWNCHQYHASTEYYSDYGVYDVAITVPREFVVGATGRRESSEDNGDGTVTHRHRQEDVHSFTWTASPDYLVILDRFESADLPAVDLRLLLQPEHRAQADRHLYATKAALASYGAWYGPYPYGHVTIVDPAFGSGAGGMEYPTLFTAGTRIFNPYGGGSPESVTIHEAGHQFWYGLVGNNEFEDAWLDEGLNTFSTDRTMNHTYGERQVVHRFFVPPGTTRMRGFFALLLRDLAHYRSPLGNRMRSYRKRADFDRQDTHSHLYYPTSGSALSYSKTALWLGTLERLLGWERLQPAMALFFERWRYRHPGPEDFFTALESGTGEDLQWFFDQVFHSSERFDYCIQSVISEEVELEGWVDGTDGDLVYESPGETGETRYRSEVVVRRLGGGVFPVEVLLVFEDGGEKRILWSGEDRWRLMVEERPSRLRYAVVDPEEILLLDLDRTNNSRLVDSAAGGSAFKWASRWMIWLEDYLTMVSFFG